MYRAGETLEHSTVIFFMVILLSHSFLYLGIMIEYVKENIIIVEAKLVGIFKLGNTTVYPIFSDFSEQTDVFQGNLLYFQV